MPLNTLNSVKIKACRFLCDSRLSELMASNNKASNIPTTTTYRGDRSVEIPFSLQPTSFGTNNGKQFLQQGKVKDEKTEAKNNDVDELAERANFALEVRTCLFFFHV